VHDADNSFVDAISFDVFSFKRWSLSYQVMTGRWIQLSYVRSVTVSTGKTLIFIDCQQLFADILAETLFVVTFRASSYWDIRFQTTQGSCLSDVYVARRAFRHMVLLFAPTIVNELQ